MREGGRYVRRQRPTFPGSLSSPSSFLLLPRSLGTFLEELTIPPALISRIMDGDVGDEDYGDRLRELG